MYRINFKESVIPNTSYRQVQPLPTDEELVRTQDGREETFLHRQHHAFIAHENAEHTVINILEEGEMCVEGYVQHLDRTWQLHSMPKWTILGDSLWDVIVQGSFALVGLKTSNASPINDTLILVIAIVYSIGFLAAIGGKLRDSSIMRGIGSVVTMLGFLQTMILLLGAWVSDFNLLV